MKFMLRIAPMFLSAVNTFCGDQGFTFDAAVDGRQIALIFPNQQMRDDVEGYVGRLQAAIEAL